MVLSSFMRSVLKFDFCAYFVLFFAFITYTIFYNVRAWLGTAKPCHRYRNYEMVKMSSFLEYSCVMNEHCLKISVPFESHFIKLVLFLRLG